MVDVNNKQLIVYRSPVNGVYENKIILSLEEQVSPLAFPNINITINEIFSD